MPGSIFFSSEPETTCDSAKKIGEQKVPGPAQIRNARVHSGTGKMTV